MKKKIFTLLTLLVAVCSGAWAQTTLFSAAPTSETLSVPAKSTDLEITSTYATVSGGTMYVTSEQTSAKDLITGNAFVMTNNNTFFKVVMTQALQAGDVITINYQGGTKNGDNKGVWVSSASSRPGSAPAAAITSSSDSYQDGTYTVTAEDEYVGKTTFYIYRAVGATQYFKAVTVTRPGIDTASPTITTDLSDAAYAANLGTPLALSIVAEHYTGYQWYTCDSEGNNEVAIDGAIASTYNYTPSAEGTVYLKCIVTNTNATGTKTATSKVATVNVTASTDATVKSISVVANGTYTASASGTAYTATIAGTSSATVTITPNHSTAFVTCGLTVGAAGAAIEVAATAGEQLSFSVTAGDGVTVVNYTLDINQAANKVATNNAYYLSVGEAIYGGQQVVGDDITMTYSNAATGTFQAAVSDASVSSKDANYVASTPGNTVNGSSSSIAGTWYEFSPTKSGLLTVGLVINDGKTLTIFKNDKNTTITDIVEYWANGEATLNASLKATGKVYGLVTLRVEADQNYYFSVSGSKLGYYGFKFIPDESVTIAASGYSTFCSSNPINCASLPSGLTAYEIRTSDISGSTINPNAVTSAVSAGTGLLLKGTGGSTYSIPVAASGTALEDNKLVGVTTATAIGGASTVYHYILKDGAFYHASAGTLAAGKAYLKLDSAPSAAREFNIVFEGETTGINEELRMKNEESVYYNIAGQRVAQPTKGLYIVNGKKVIIK